MESSHLSHTSPAIEEKKEVGGRIVGRHGNTSKGRLDNLDAFLQHYEPRLFAPTGNKQLSTVFDVGFGDAIDTFTDFASRLAARRAEGTLRVVGTESDAERLEAGRRAIAGQLEGDRSLALRAGELSGWFVLPLEEGEPAPVFVRALNVLRDYRPQDAGRALRTLAKQLAPGGLLMEGSASTMGDRAVVALIRKTGSAPPSLLPPLPPPPSSSSSALPPSFSSSSSATAAADGEHNTSVGRAGETGGEEAREEERKEEGGGGRGGRELRLEALALCVDLETRRPRLKGQPIHWFTRQIPQLWQHGAVKDGSSLPQAPPESSEGSSPVAVGAGVAVGEGEGKKGKKKNARGRGGRRWMGGGGR